MSNLTDRANYLKGLADGLKLNTEKNSNRLLLELIDLVAEATASLDELEKRHTELADFVEALDEDLAEVEETVSDILDEDEFEDELPDEDDSDSVEDETAEESDEEDGEDDVKPISLKKNGASDDGEDVVYYNCPHCAKEVKLSVQSLDLDENMACPFCGEPLFPDAAKE